MNTRQALTSSGKDDWRTPRAVLDQLDAEFSFDFDAAASCATWEGRPYLGPGGAWNDALSDRPWRDLGRVAFLNPPYSRAGGAGRGILAWHERAFTSGLVVVVLCPPHPGRRWFQLYASRADEIRVYRSRLAFVDPSTGEAARGNTQDSCLVIYRSQVQSSAPRWSWIDVPKRVLR